MVIVRLLGGMGNQMFQYAAARRLSHVLGTDLKLDVSSFDRYRMRPYGLRPMAIREDFATAREVRALNGLLVESPLKRRLLRVWQKLWTERRWTLLFEDGLAPVDERVLRATGHVYLGGYWLSERYFKDAEEIIRREFTVRDPPDAEAAAMAGKIERVKAVSVHVRRGEFSDNAEINRKHGTCSPAYYHDAMDLIASRVANPHFFVFSEDLEWVRVNVRFKHPVEFVPYRPESQSHENLRLMSLCPFHITANSTFSWWGAWLNNRPGKIVVTPRHWMADRNQDSPDLIPDGWIKL